MWKLRSPLCCVMIRDFSSKYSSIRAHSIWPLLLNWMSMYFPNREELSFRRVRALPNASRIGLDSISCCSMDECCPEAAARNWSINLVETVFPDPDSPLTTTHYSCLANLIVNYDWIKLYYDIATLWHHCQHITKNDKNVKWNFKLYPGNPEEGLVDKWKDLSGALPVTISHHYDEWLRVGKRTREWSYKDKASSDSLLWWPVLPFKNTMTFTFLIPRGKVNKTKSRCIGLFCNQNKLLFLLYSM